MGDDINVMSANGKIINQALNYLNQNNNINNNGSIEDITETLNSNLALLDQIQTQLSVSNNVNIDNLLKREQLIKMQNDDLIQQLRNLQNIESTIENKNRYIEQIHNNINLQQNNIYFLTFSIVLGFILFGLIIMYGMGRISNKIFMYGLIIITVIYGLYFIYFFNIFYIKSAITSLFGNNPEARFGQAIQKWAEDIKTQTTKDIYGLEKNWINQNCNCPQEEEQQINNYIYAEDPNVSVTQQPGYFYYDGSTPQQLLLPTPITSELENIEWVDYSQPVGNEYNFNLNDPSNLLKYKLSQSNRLIPNNNINTRTYTTNL
jgi:hypothetical protein